MLRPAFGFFAVVSVALCANTLSHQERKEGFALLFDGRTLTQWHSIKVSPNAGAWHARKGILTWVKGGSWLATDDTYYDFILRLEYRTGPQSNSGILLRASPSADPAVPRTELKISSDAGKRADTHSSGSLSGAVAPSKNMAKPDGEWNQVEITILKRELKAVWNGEKILETTLDDRVRFGHIGIEASESGAPVEFRNIRIKVVRYGPNFSQDR
jgi:hypothetical protein